MTTRSNLALRSKIAALCVVILLCLFGTKNAFAGAESSTHGTAFYVALIALEARVIDKTEVELRWTTLEEINNDYFEIDRSKNGVEFEKIGVVRGAGTSTTANNYQFIDGAPYTGVSYYRLKQVDSDGAFEYFDLIAVNVPSGGFEITKIYPNPSGTDFNVDLFSKEPKKIKLSLIGISGKQSRIQMYSVVGHQTLSFSLVGIPPGVYFLNAYQGKNLMYSTKVIRE